MSNFAVNTDPHSRAILALLLPQSVPSHVNTGHSKLIQFCSIEIFTINFSALDPESAFVSMIKIHRRKFRGLHTFSGSNILVQTLDGRLVLWNINAPDTGIELRDTNTQVPSSSALKYITIDTYLLLPRSSRFARQQSWAGNSP
jgi:hypothetical protein